jgi:uncharacterized protein YaiL (DUF2058 family)
MRNALQDQLLKAGLAKKSKLDQVAREQTKQRHAKSAPSPSAEDIDAQRLAREKAERDRALQAERNAQAKAQELRAQARQIIEQNTLPPEGDSEYRFADGSAIRSLLVSAAIRKQLSRGSVVIARLGDSYALIPRAAADKVAARDPAFIVVDHAGSASAGGDDDDEHYSQFVVPDDLVW